MPDHILVPLDGSPLATRALEYAQATFPEASLTALYVINPMDSLLEVETGGLPVATEWYDTAQERADTVLEAAADRVAAADVDLETATEVGAPAREILRYAADHDVDQIVMGSHGREGLERAILGSVAETVMRRAPVPVTIVR